MEAKTKLELWMGDARDDRWLAEALGCSRSQASRIRRGRSRPSPAGAFQIEKLTRGKVKAAELLGPDAIASDPSPNRKAA